MIMIFCHGVLKHHSLRLEKAAPPVAPPEPAPPAPGPLSNPIESHVTDIK